MTTIHFYTLKTYCIMPALVVLMLAVLNWECKKTTGPEPPKPLEIKWQQTALDSAALSVFADPYTGTIYADYAPGYKVELLRSFDRGETWSVALPNFDIFSMAFNENGDIFAFNNTSEGSFMLRSSDGGDTWNRLNTPNMRYPHSLLFHNSGNMFLGDLGGIDAWQGGIYRSSDNGISWKKTSFPDSLGVYSLISSSNKGDIFAGTTMGVYRSTDTGESWLPVNKGIRKVDGKHSYIIDLVSNHDNNYIFLVDAFYDKIYRSVNNGDSWELTALYLPANSDIFDLEINLKGEIFIAVLNSEQGSESDRGVFRSMDNGDSWQQVNNGLSDTRYFYNLAIDSLGFLYVATENGVFRTVNPTTN